MCFLLYCFGWVVVVDGFEFVKLYLVGGCVGGDVEDGGCVGCVDFGVVFC